MKAPTNAIKPVFPADADTKEYAASLDEADPLCNFRDEFIIPSKANIACKRLAKPGAFFFCLMRLIADTRFRALGRIVHLPLRKLPRNPAQSHSKVHRSTAGHMVVNRCGWSFHGSRGLPAQTMAAAG